MGISSFSSCRHLFSPGRRSLHSIIPGRVHSSSKLVVYAQEACFFSNATTRGRSVVTFRGSTWAPVQQISKPMDAIDRTVDILASAFEDDPVYRWFLNDLPISEHPKILPRLFRPFLTQALLNDGLVIEAGNFGSCGLAMPPGSKLENPWTLLQAGLVPALWHVGFGTIKRAICEYTRGVRPILEKALTKEEQRNHWYGVFMGTTVEHRCKGLGSSIFLHMQDRARADGLPLSFEAATAKNRDLYLRHGSQIVGEFTVGKGEVGPDGLVNKQGEGIIIWSMVWRP